MIAPVPLILVLLGTALMAIVIFAPQAQPAQRASAPISFAPPAVEVVGAPEWPRLVDPRADACDVATRLAIADALGAVRRPWAAAILARAACEERDSTVRDAIAAALQQLRYAEAEA
jgi:hypothetical protein